MIRLEPQYVGFGDAESPVWPALVAMDNGRPVLWNGFIAMPCFNRAIAEDVVRELMSAVKLPAELHLTRYLWVGDALEAYTFDQFEGGVQLFSREVTQPETTPAGEKVWPVMAYGGTWFAWSADELAERGIDPGLREWDADWTAGKRVAVRLPAAVMEQYQLEDR